MEESKRIAPVASEIEQQSSPFYINISENGLKTLTEENIFVTSKFHKIQWHCDPNYELPIKLTRGLGPGSETPVTLSQAFLA